MSTQPRPDPAEVRHLTLPTNRRAVAAPAPLDNEPRSVRPPFLVLDDRYDHLRTTDPEGWRLAIHLNRFGRPARTARLARPVRA
jgi:hypothetical protein